MDNRQHEAAQQLSSLGMKMLDLSNQPKTLKEMGKKLIRIGQGTEDIGIAQMVDVLKQNIDNGTVPRWEVDLGDERSANQEQLDEAKLTLKQIEDFIENAPALEAMDHLRAVCQQASNLLSEHHYKMHKLSDYRHHISKTQLVSQATHQNLSGLGIGVESRLPPVEMLTKTPSPSNHRQFQAAIEAANHQMHSISVVIGSMVITVIIQVTVLLMYTLCMALIEMGLIWFKQSREKRKEFKSANLKTDKASVYDALTVNESLRPHLELDRYGDDGEIPILELSDRSLVSKLKLAGLHDITKAASKDNLKILEELLTDLETGIERCLTMSKECLEVISGGNDIKPYTDEQAFDDNADKSITYLEGQFESIENTDLDVENIMDSAFDVIEMYDEKKVTKIQGGVEDLKVVLKELDKKAKGKLNLSAEQSDYVLERSEGCRQYANHIQKNVDMHNRYQKLALDTLKIMNEHYQEFDPFVDTLKQNKDQSEQDDSK